MLEQHRVSLPVPRGGHAAEQLGQHRPIGRWATSLIHQSGTRGAVGAALKGGIRSIHRTLYGILVKVDHWMIQKRQAPVIWS
ncbi:hypothetical protein AA11237_3374 [Acidocella aminolytica 101 = DSM 11237]|nr:hypothetical protein AA11237_3374 [Acidocella aminolytica 101 = DSM 11237]